MNETVDDPSEQFFVPGTSFINHQEQELGTIELSIMCFLIPSAFILFLWTIRNQNVLGLTRAHSILFIVAGASFFLCKLLYLPWNISFYFPQDALINSDAGFLATNILGLMADLCYCFSFFSYSIAVTYRFQKLSVMSNKRQKILMMCLQVSFALLYGTGLFVIFPVTNWSFITDSPSSAFWIYFGYSVYYPLMALYFAVIDFAASCITLKLLYQKVFKESRVSKLRSKQVEESNEKAASIKAKISFTRKSSLSKTQATFEEQRYSLYKKTRTLMISWGLVCILSVSFTIASVSRVNDAEVDASFTVSMITGDFATLCTLFEFFFSLYFITLVKDWVSLGLRGRLSQVSQSKEAEAESPRRQSLGKSSGWPFKWKSRAEQPDVPDSILENSAIEESNVADVFSHEFSATSRPGYVPPSFQ